MRKIFFCALTGLLLLFSFTETAAQRRRDAKDRSVTIVFSEKTSPATQRKSSGDENIVKIAPLGFIGGVFPLIYERRINDFLTIEVAGGLTHRNYIRGAFLSEEGPEIKEFPWGGDLNNSYDEAEGMYQFDYRKAQMGYMFRVMPKIYFEEEAPDGNYVGLQYNYLKYKFSIPKYEVSGSGGYGHTGAMVDEYENVSDYMVYFGRQIVNDRITLESASGIGLRQVSGKKYVASTSNGLVKDGLASYKQNTINFGVMFTLGYHF